MSFVMGKKTIKREIIFNVEGDLGEKISSSFVVTLERPMHAVRKEFSLLFARFADILSARQNLKPGEGETVEAFTSKLDVAEQALSDFVKDKIKSWDKVFANEDKTETVEFNDNNLTELFADREARRAVFENYQELVSGVKKAEEKNSEAQEKDGQ